jgi:RNA polymerase sigma-70 factor (ECF subfamily)
VTDRTAPLLDRARAGDQHAFEALVAPHERELHVHCYRMLGSVHDAEDVLQETLVAAWRGLPTFEERSSMRTWLYRIATNRCLNWQRARRRRPPVATTVTEVEPPPPTQLGDVIWLEPYPDVLLEGLTDAGRGPEAEVEAREAISLAFITALQHLPPRQRVVLVLRDVLAFRARECAEILDTTEESVTSALKRARATMRDLGASSDSSSPPTGAGAEPPAVQQLARALERGRVDELVSVLTEDVWLTMPPLPLEYQGRELVGRFFTRVAYRNDRRYRIVHTGANGQPALAVYLRDPRTGLLHANGVMVLTLDGDLISAMTRFDNTVLPHFGLPRTLDDPTGDPTDDPP